jgi:hypothetical protein
VKPPAGGEGVFSSGCKCVIGSFAAQSELCRKSCQTQKILTAILLTIIELAPPVFKRYIDHNKL